MRKLLTDEKEFLVLDSFFPDKGDFMINPVPALEM